MTEVKINSKKLELRKDHVEWLLANVKFEDYKYYWWKDKIAFKNEDDAILFKLRFDCNS